MSEFQVMLARWLAGDRFYGNVARTWVRDNGGVPQGTRVEATTSGDLDDLLGVEIAPETITYNVIGIEGDNLVLEFGGSITKVMVPTKDLRLV